MAFDPERLEVRGEPKAVVEGVEVNDNGFAVFDLSVDGTLAYVPAGSTSKGTLVLGGSSGPGGGARAPAGRL